MIVYYDVVVFQSEISEVILFGGGTRVPKVQEMLKKAIGLESLGKGINSDEAAALGRYSGRRLQLKP